MARGANAVRDYPWSNYLSMINISRENHAKPLQRGDEVITVAASSAITDEESLLKGVKVLESWGLVSRPQCVTQRSWGYLAGDDSIRYNNLHPKNPAPLLAFARGGWGAARLLERHQPWRSGWLLGFSDVSSLLLSRLSAGFDGGVHGPLLTSIGEEPIWSQERVRSILFGKPVPDLIGTPWKSGIATGPLVISNLTVASHLLGSSHMPDLKGAILILEDIGEAPYRIDRMLTHWRLVGALQGLAGLGFGDFSNCEDLNDFQIEKAFGLEEVLKERCKDLEIPIIGNLPIGHCCGNAALPQGRIAKLDGRQGILSLQTSC